MTLQDEIDQLNSKIKEQARNHLDESRKNRNSTSLCIRKDDRNESFTLKKRIDDLEKYNVDLKDQLRKTTDILTVSSVPKSDVRYNRMTPTSEHPKQSFPMHEIRPFERHAPSFSNTMVSHGNYPVENINLLSNLPSFSNNLTQSISILDPKKNSSNNGIKLKLMKLKA
jgi:hypothetical protein